MLRIGLETSRWVIEKGAGREQTGGGGVPREAGSQGERKKAESLDPTNCKGLSNTRTTRPCLSPLLIYAGSQSPQGQMWMK